MGCLGVLGVIFLVLFPPLGLIILLVAIVVGVVGSRSGQDVNVVVPGSAESDELARRSTAAPGVPDAPGAYGWDPQAIEAALWGPAETGPKKRCPSCGHENSGVRQTCKNCRAPLS